jgi:hypothetical protein
MKRIPSLLHPIGHGPHPQPDELGGYPSSFYHDAPGNSRHFFFSHESLVEIENLTSSWKMGKIKKYKRILLPYPSYSMSIDYS